jgi:O-antigen ligase
VALALLVLVGAIAGFAAARSAAGPAPDDARMTRLAVAGLAVLLATISVLLLAGVSKVGSESVRVPTGPRAQRLHSVESERYDYWRVAGDAFAGEPIAGVGSGGFASEWLRERPADSLLVRDAHSLYVETAAELGLVGFACLVLLLVGAVLAGRRALARDPLLAAGPAAALVAWGVHAGLDWDWEMPALTMPAIVLLAVLALAADEPPQRAVSTR